MKRSRTDTAKKKRADKILKSARKVFIKKGYTNTSIQDIAGEAELSVGTIYLYYKNKDELYVEVCLKVLQSQLAILENSVKIEGSTYNQLLEISLAQTVFQEKKESELLNVNLYELNISKTLKEKLSLNDAEWHNIVTSVFENGIKNGEIASDTDPLEAAYLLFSTLEGLWYFNSYGYFDQVGYKVENLIKAHLKIMMTGLSKP